MADPLQSGSKFREWYVLRIRQPDEQDTDLEAVLQGLLSGQYSYAVRLVCFNAGEGWSRDATSELADTLARRPVDTDTDVSAALQNFIAANATHRFGLRLALPYAWPAVITRGKPIGWRPQREAPDSRSRGADAPMT